MKKFCVYKHTFPNGKMYIGITSRPPKERWENGLSGYTKEHQNVMYNAIKKYGWENVEHEILFDGLTEDEAKAKEIELIAELHTYIHDPLCNGYNMTLGGEGTLGHKLSEESKKRLSESHKNQIAVNSIPIICDGIVYDSVTKFAEEHKMCVATVRAWLNGKHKIPKEWYDKGLRYCDNDLNVKKEIQDENHKKEIFYNGIVYSSQKKLAKELNVTPSTVCCWLNGTNPLPLEIFEKGFYVLKGESKITVASSKKTKVKYDGKIYKTQRELADYLGVDYRIINSWLMGKTKIPQAYLEKGLEKI